MSDHTPVVLVVDDHPELADLYSQWLAEAYRVRTAYSGAKAMDLLSEEIDAVVTDRDMPKVSGEDLARRIRQRRLDCSVAMVTGNVPDDTPPGVDTYLAKPVSQDRLTRVVDVLLSIQSRDGNPLPGDAIRDFGIPLRNAD